MRSRMNIIQHTSIKKKIAVKRTNSENKSCYDIIYFSYVDCLDFYTSFELVYVDLIHRFEDLYI